MQLALFDEEAPDLPEGFRYQPGLITPAEEAGLAARIAPLPFKPFEFHGYLGRRQTVAFGWRYDYSAQRSLPAPPIPDFLHSLRARAAAFAGLDEADLVQALVTQYEPGAPIGWHRDKPQYAEVVGVSLLSPCPFRLRRKAGATWERRTVTVQPRSVYLLSGPARHAWEHSIPPLDALRYSITFRRLA